MLRLVNSLPLIYMEPRKGTNFKGVPNISGQNDLRQTESKGHSCTNTRPGQYLTHEQSHITRAVAATDSCFSLVGVLRHGIAVASQTYERTKQCIKGPLLPRRVQSIHLSASSTQHMAATARLCGIDFISDDDAKTDLVQQPSCYQWRGD